MKRRTLVGLAASLALSAGAATALAQGTAITYQGQLKNSGTAVNSATDMQFSLWTAASGGSQIGSTVTQTSVAVNQGLFTVPVDFGVNPYTASQNLWLQIAVRNPAGGGAYVPMGTRQLLTPSPFSLATRGLNVSAANRVGILADPYFDGRTALTIGSAGGSFPAASILFKNGAGGGDWEVAVFDDATNYGGFTINRKNLDFPFIIEGDTSDILLNSQASGGRVGIGTNAPTDKLHVNGGNVAVTGGNIGGFFTPTAASPNLLIGRTTAVSGQQSSALGFLGSGILNAGIGYTPSSSNPSRIDVGFGGDSNPALTSSVFTINSSGSVGIGTTAPFNRLDVAAGGSIGNSTLIGPPNDPANRGTKVGFGYHTPADGCGPDNFRGMRVQVVAGSLCGNSTDLTFWTDACNFSCPREVMRLNGEGNLGIGLVPVALGYRLQLPNTASNAGRGIANRWDTYSSRDLKQNIETLADPLSTISKLRGVSFDWKAADEHGNHAHDLGFIAEEVNAVLPDIVTKNADGKVTSLDYGRVVPVTVEAIKQLKGENDQLKARLEKLEALVAAQADAQADAK